jgi:dATP pyrophosphohydrolase
VSTHADLVACWPFRVDAAGRPEILLIHRAPGRIYSGIWQCVTGSLEPGETMVQGALREVAEETGFGPADIEAFFETDLVSWFHVAAADALLSEVAFAARIRPGATVRLSIEHDDLRWSAPAAAHDLVVWPSYHRVIDQIEWLVANPEKAEVYRLPAPS